MTARRRWGRRMRAVGGERTPPRVGAIYTDVEVGSARKGAPRRRVLTKEEDEAPAGSGGALSPLDLAATGHRGAEAEACEAAWEGQKTAAQERLA